MEAFVLRRWARFGLYIWLWLCDLIFSPAFAFVLTLHKAFPLSTILLNHHHKIWAFLNALIDRFKHPMQLS